MTDFNQQNHKLAWEFVAEHYKGGTALPAWGTCGEGSTIAVLGDVYGKDVLELGCGSGDSIIYLLKQGANKVVGIDFSKQQIKLAKERISVAFKDDPDIRNKVSLIHQSIDEPLPMAKFDLVVAVYSIGWANEPSKLFEKIHDLLKPQGEFCFSWDHYLAHIITKKGSDIVIEGNYHEPQDLTRTNWKGSGYTIQTHQMRPSDWFWLLVTSGFRVDGFWEAKPERNSNTLEIYSDVYSSQVSDKIPNCIIFKARKDSNEQRKNNCDNW